MKILQVHNFHDRVGGEDLSVNAEADLLRARGHEVVPFHVNNRDAKAKRFGGAAGLIYNVGARWSLSSLIADTSPELVHITNTFPLLSSSVYDAVAHHRLPLVQSIRNYRYGCVNGYLYRDGEKCTKCLRRTVLWPGAVHRCYGGSLPRSTAAAISLSINRVRDVWRRRVHAFIAISSVIKERNVEAGLPGERIHLKPNFLSGDAPDRHRPVPATLDADPSDHDGYLYAGFLSEPKGVRLLLDAWRSDDRLPPLTFVGEGPLEDDIRTLADGNDRLHFAGRVPPDEVTRRMSRSLAVVVPSMWDEPFGRVTLEALSSGALVVGSDAGATPDMVRHGHNGWLFRSGDVEDLRGQLFAAAATTTETRQSMRRAAYETYLELGTPASNYRTLMDIYQSAIRVAAGGTEPSTQRHDIDPGAVA